MPDHTGAALSSPACGGPFREQQVLDLAVLAGRVLLENGAEIFRVQETVKRILDACGLDGHHVYALSNGIIATVEQETGRSCYALRHVPQSSVNLRRIAAVNEVSRQIAREGALCDVDAMRQRLHECAAIPKAPALLRLLACGTGSACFCYILGGTVADSFVALLAGLVLQLFLLAGARLSLNKYIECILGAAVGTICCRLLFLAGLGTTVDGAIVGVIIPLVPGVVFTTGIRDFFTSDYLSGIIHLVDALLLAVSIAVGVGVVLTGWNLLWGGLA